MTFVFRILSVFYAATLFWVSDAKHCFFSTTSLRMPFVEFVLHFSILYNWMLIILMKQQNSDYSVWNLCFILWLNSTLLIWVSFSTEFVFVFEMLKLFLLHISILLYFWHENWVYFCERTHVWAVRPVSRFCQQVFEY